MIRRRLETTRFSKKMILLAVALGLACSATAWARSPRPDGHGPDPGVFPDRLLEEVGVDQTKREEIATLSQTSEVRAGELHEQIHTARETLRGLLEQDSPDSDRVMNKVEEIGALEIEADKHRLTTMLSIRTLLTPEQRARLAKLHDAHSGKRFRHKMHRVENACSDTLEGACSQAKNGHDRMNCLHDQGSDVSARCKKAMRKMHRARHPRFDSKPSGPPPEN